MPSALTEHSRSCQRILGVLIVVALVFVVAQSGPIGPLRVLAIALDSAAIFALLLVTLIRGVGPWVDYALSDTHSKIESLVTLVNITTALPFDRTKMSEKTQQELDAALKELLRSLTDTKTKE